MVRGALKGLFCIALSSVAVSKPEVIHLPQTHSLPNTDYSHPQNYLKIAQSQHEISLALLREKAEYGMTEHVFQDYGTAISEAREIFPEGIPPYFEALNQEQRIFLAKHGALLTLLSLGNIKEVWGATTVQHWEYGNSLSEDCQKAWGNPTLENREHILKATQKLESYSFSERENFSLSRIEAFLKNSGEKISKVFLVYGSQHDFLRHQENFTDLDIRRYKLESDSGPATYFGPVPEWGYTNVFSPDDQIKFYFLIFRDHPEFSREDLKFAEAQQLEILQMFKRIGLQISQETPEYLLNSHLKTIANSLVVYKP